MIDVDGDGAGLGEDRARQGDEIVEEVEMLGRTPAIGIGDRAGVQRVRPAAIAARGHSMVAVSSEGRIDVNEVDRSRLDG